MKNLRFVAALLAALMTVTMFAQATGELPAEQKPLAGEVNTVDGVAAEAVSSPDDWNLLLVNPWNKLPENYVMEQRRLANGLTVDARIYDDLNAMLIDCWGAGLHPVVCSAYRSQATQQRLYNNKIARLRAAGYGWNSAVKEAGRWVAAPGTSEHQTGMALDIVSYKYQLLTEKQAETAEQQWLMEHCWEYGFILRYPKEKTGVTGIGYEPWHYRYVGRAAAAAMKESGQCLEEYLETLRNPEAVVADAVEETAELEAVAEPTKANTTEQKQHT